MTKHVEYADKLVTVRRECCWGKRAAFNPSQGLSWLRVPSTL